MPLVLHVLILHEGNCWVAQALEVEIAAQGRSPEVARKAFLQALSAQMRMDRAHGRRPLQGIPPAPDEYWDVFFKRGRNLEQMIVEGVEGNDVSPAYMIQAIAEEGALASS